MGCCCSTRDLPIKKQITFEITSPGSPIAKSDFVKFSSGDIKEFYDILQEIGTGGFGTVFKVKDKRTGLIRAMKEIPKTNLDQNTSAKMIEEIDILKDLDHPNIMRIFEVIETTKFYYVITELLSGGELFDKLIKHKRISEKFAAKYLYEMMSALNYCHNKGIVHRDIKPENLLFETSDENSSLKVIDFGISHRLLPGKKIKTNNGTL